MWTAWHAPVIISELPRAVRRAQARPSQTAPRVGQWLRRVALLGRRSREAPAKEPASKQEDGISIASSPAIELRLKCFKVSSAGFLAMVRRWSGSELHLRLPSEKPIEASLFNGDDQGRRRLSSLFAGPPPRFGSSPSRRPCFRMGFELPQILFSPRIANGALLFRHGFHFSLRRIKVAIVAVRVGPIRLRSSTS
jgi:hypothetical protein